MKETLGLLDHGYIKFIESWGSDERIIEAARMSTDKGFAAWLPYLLCKNCGAIATDYEFRKAHAENIFIGVCHHPGAKPNPDGSYPDTGRHDWEDHPKGDAGLLRYLYENKHATPFEFAGLVIEVKAPIMVFREWHRHRTQSYNEMSARYTPLPDENYRPTPERCLVVQGRNKQASKVEGAGELTHEKVLRWLSRLDEAYALSQAVYKEGLDIGIPKELARLPVPVARYTKMRAHTCLRNWLAFMTLRSAPVAQHEIRVYSNALGEIIAERFQRTWELFTANCQQA